jgi:hypothetical protein
VLQFTESITNGRVRNENYKMAGRISAFQNRSIGARFPLFHNPMTCTGWPCRCRSWGKLKTIYPPGGTTAPAAVPPGATFSHSYRSAFDRRRASCPPISKSPLFCADERLRKTPHRFSMDCRVNLSADSKANQCEHISRIAATTAAGRPPTRLRSARAAGTPDNTSSNRCGPTGCKSPALWDTGRRKPLVCRLTGYWFPSGH